MSLLGLSDWASSAGNMRRLVEGRGTFLIGGRVVEDGWSDSVSHLTERKNV